MRSALLRHLPDLPRWVETRGLLLSGRGEVIAARPDSGDVLLRETFGSLVCIAGHPQLDRLGGLARDPRVLVVLCARETVPEVAPELPGWRQTTAVIHALTEGWAGAAPARAAMVAILSRQDEGRLSLVPASLRKEITAALESAHVAAAFLEGVPVSFCYPSYETEALWDVSIDTLAPYRRRGLAAACVEFLIDHMRAHGKSPVWGALEDNLPSLALAKALGFVPVDRLSVFSRA